MVRGFPVRPEPWTVPTTALALGYQPSQTSAPGHARGLCISALGTAGGPHAQQSCALVADADRSAEQVMNPLKPYASRSLNRIAWDEPNCRRWPHHGSTRY